MAIMIPERPRQFDPSSLEGVMFEALAELPDNYYVFHSVRITDLNDHTLHECEIDFVLFNRFLGILCLEAKAGQVKYSGGEWLYGNGIPMNHDGPYNQASGNKHKLRKHILNSKLASLVQHCKFLHAVWFPSLSCEQLKAIALPPEADKNITLTKEALENPEPFLERVFSTMVYSNGNPVETNITENEEKRLVKEILCPEFEVFPTASFEYDIKNIVFHRLLKEQTSILNFLEDQQSAAINGAAGTGKTMVAIEKAKRHSRDGERVLFLCFNLKLKEFLEKNHPSEFIDYYTIAGFVCRICNTSVADYKKAKEKLEDMYFAGSFPYKHVIIDEGQDFGCEVIEEADIIQLIHDIVIDREEFGGTFYVFYDKLQLVQSRKMPKFIDDIDCRLTLTRNCRNTENIATTSLKPLTERKPKMFDGTIKGIPAKLHFCHDDVVARIDEVINGLLAEGLKDIVILSCGTEETSVLKGRGSNDKYKKCLFTTCRKFKGLEADAVILIDINKELFEDNSVLVYYVGTSRARYRLDMITTMSDDECEWILANCLNYKNKIKKPKKDFAAALNAVGSLL